MSCVCETNTAGRYSPEPDERNGAVSRPPLLSDAGEPQRVSGSDGSLSRGLQAVGSERRYARSSDWTARSAPSGADSQCHASSIGTAV
jgi:hypothetical protein